MRSVIRNVESEITKKFNEMKRETSKLRREHDDIYKTIGGETLVRKSAVRDRMQNVYT